ncbi:hypothetical protein [Saccharibacillus endophyticus]|uniref:DUF3829 domain-containing protein n=1 Tax=Saccharibacillus endophyticus TaxID=2060666 RepID=A0ABQ2A3P8_9BACL|nr:hypothetical protein [Saccharibacillus endophyticus]GGH84416.1 hypothetical protein GCM10007362_39430 [Saccharibacillus endophyticus]
MKTYTLPSMKKCASSALVCGILFSGTFYGNAFTPSTYAAADSVNVQASQTHSIDWNKPEKIAMLQKLAMSSWAAGDFYSDPDNARYQAVKAASDQCYALLLDSTSSTSKLNAASATLDSALTAYIEEYIRDASLLERQTFQMVRMLNDSIGTTPGTYPQSAADRMFTIIDQAQAVAYDETATVQQFRQEYRNYIDGAAALRDAMHFDRAEKHDALGVKRQEAEQLAAGQANDAYVQKLLNDFCAQANGLESLLNGTSGLLAVEAAERNVQTTYDKLAEAALLSDELVQARKLLDSPKGIRAGQYPSSSFGELRKAINKSALTLSRTSTQAQLKEARTTLAEAVVRFQSTLR